MKTLKKLSAILLSVMLLAALLPANLVFAGTSDTLPVYYSVSVADTDAADLDFSNQYSYEKVKDSRYGTTVKINAIAGKAASLRYKGTEATCYSTNGSLMIKTAIKKYDKNIDTALRFGAVTAAVPFSFETDGYIYVAGTKTSYTYDTNVWYEVAMTVNHNTGYTESIINGGAYKNLVLSGYNEKLVYPSTIDGGKNRAYIGAYDGSATGDSTVEIGYVSVSEGTLTGAEASFTDDFENVEEVINSKNHGIIGDYSNTVETNIELVSDDEYGKVLKMVNGNTLRDMAELPITGTHTLSMSVKAETGAIINLRDIAYSVETMLLKFNTSGNIETSAGHISVNEEKVSYVKNRWYDVKFTLNMTDGKYSVIVTDTVTGEDITASDLTLKQITGENIPRLRLKADGDPAVAYYDNISLAVAGETIRRQNVAPAPKAEGVFVSEEPTVSFTQKLDASTVNKENVELSTDDGVYDDYTPTVSADGKSIVIKHTNPLAENTAFTVKINGVKNIAGTDVAAYTYNFTTAKAYEIGDVSFSGAAAGQAGEVTATVNIKFNDDEAHEVAFIAAVYDSESGELVACNIDNRKGATAVEGSADLSATVTIPNVEGKTYEVYAYLWDGLTTLNPYIAATPLQ